MNRRRSAHESPYWPAFVDILVALLAVVMLAGSVPPKPPVLIEPMQAGPGPGGGHPITPAVTWAEFHGRFLAARVNALSAAFDASVEPLKVRHQGGSVIVIVGGLPDSGDDLSGLPKSHVDAIEHVWHGFFIDGAEAEFLRDQGLRITQVQSYAYADKEAGTSIGLNQWLRAVDKSLKVLVGQLSLPSRVAVDILPYYPDVLSQEPFVGIRFVFSLDKNGEQDARSAYTSQGGRL